MIDWHTIDTVLLDMDGTLLDLHFDNHFWLQHVPKRYADLHQIDFGSACEALHPHMREIRGSLDWYDVHYWSAYTQMNVMALKNEVSDLIQPRPSAIELLDFLSAKTLVLATNAHHDVVQLKLSKVPLGDYFDHIFTSHQLGAPKEQQGYWDALQHRIGFDPQRTLFIDDNADVLDSAKCFGIQHLFTIQQPDLHQPAQADNGFVAIEHFDQLMKSL